MTKFQKRQIRDTIFDSREYLIITSWLFHFGKAGMQFLGQDFLQGNKLTKREAERLFFCLERDIIF